MTVQIPLTEAAEARLREYAATAGKDLPTVLVEAIEEKLAASDPSDSDASPTLPPDQWIAELRAWAASHQPLDYVADDSRESIYAGRGE